MAMRPPGGPPPQMLQGAQQMNRGPPSGGARPPGNPQIASEKEPEVHDSKGDENYVSANAKELEWETHTKFKPQEIPINSRTFSHELRPDYSKFAPRCDMTETVLFVSSQ